MTIDTIGTYSQELTGTSALPVRHARPAGPKGYSTSDSISSAAPMRTPATRRDYATKAATVVGLGLAVSAGLFAIGSLLRTSSLAAGRAAQNQNGFLRRSLSGLANALSALGITGEKVGRALFLVIAVPPYIVFYQLPKWLITKQLPIVAEKMQVYLAAMSQILTRLAQTIAEQAANAARLARQLAEKALSAAARLAKPVVVRMVAIWNAAVRAAQTLGRVALRAAISIASGIADIAAATLAKLAEGWRIAKQAAEWVGVQLTPYALAVAEFLSRQLVKLGELAAALGRKVAPTVLYALEALQAVARGVINGAERVGHAAARVASEVSKGARVLGGWVATAANATMHGLKIAGDLAMSAAQQVVSLSNQAAHVVYAWMTPGIQFVTSRVKAVSTTIVQVAKNLIYYVKASGRLASNIFFSVGTGIASATKWVWQQIAPALHKATLWAGRNAYSAGVWIGQQLDLIGRAIAKAGYAAMQVASDYAFRVSRAATKAFRAVGRYLSVNGSAAVAAMQQMANSLWATVRSSYEWLSAGWAG